MNASDDAVPRFPRGWSAGGVARGTGYANPNGSRRVREVQRRLLRRGYRPGPVDGRFGPRTRAAVMWFQIKHGLARTGRIDARSLATLRENREMVRIRETAPAPLPATAAGFLPVTVEPADQGWLMLLALGMLLGFAVIVWWARTDLRRRPAQAVGVEPQPRAKLTAVPAPSASAPVDVVGYVAVARGGDRDRELESTARSIGTWCEGRGWNLVRVFHDIAPAGGRLAERPGLAHVLDQIADGRVAGVVVARLGDLTRSVTELAKLLEWMDRAGAFTIALDYNLDTSTWAGEHAAGALVEIGNWERDRIAGRTQPGLTAIRTSRPARTSVRDDPELSARINRMRAQGMTLQAISDALNAAGVPTLRGGAEWRPSSVQAATGYKRPSAAQGRWDKDPV